jgi:hypothetical protein
MQGLSRESHRCLRSGTLAMPWWKRPMARRLKKMQRDCSMQAPSGGQLGAPCMAATRRRDTATLPEHYMYSTVSHYGKALQPFSPHPPNAYISTVLQSCLSRQAPSPTTLAGPVEVFCQTNRGRPRSPTTLRTPRVTKPAKLFSASVSSLPVIRRFSPPPPPCQAM